MQILMHAIAHGGCTNTVRESALKVDCWRERKKEEKTLPHPGLLKQGHQSRVAGRDTFEDCGCTALDMPK